MTDQSKAKSLPDNFLSLFNFPPQGVAASGASVQPQQPIVAAPLQVPQVPQAPQPAQGSVQLPVAPQFQPQAPQPAPQQHQAPQPAVVPQPAAVPPLAAAVTVPQPAQPTVSAPGVQDPSQQVAGQALQAQLAQAQSENAQLRAAQAQRESDAESARIAALPKQDQVLAQLELLKQQQAVTTRRAQEWQIEAEKREILRQYGNEISESSLDTSSLETLYASVPTAVQAYQLTESQMFQKFARQMGIQQQAHVEGLPPSPVPAAINGLPSPNNAGAVPSLPGNAAPQPTQHPQLSRDNVYNYAQQGVGRVFQPQGMPAPQPNSQGQYFQPTYPQPGQYPAGVVQQPQVMQASQVPQNVAGMQMAQQVGPAPTPDPNMRADGSSGGRHLMPTEAHSAIQAAQASIEASRRAGTQGAAAAGLRESMTNTIALQGGGAQPINPQSLPIPTGQDRARMHPQYLAGARV